MTGRSGRDSHQFACVVALCAAAVVGVARPARAELVFFTTGRSLSVDGHAVESGRLVLKLRGGGEMVIDAALVTAIRPDEVPYPEPVPAGAVESVLAPSSPGPHQQPATLIEHPRYDAMIRRAAAEHGVDPALVRAVVQVESGYRPRTRSRMGAVGLMQVLPATARRYGGADLYDPAANLGVGIRHLRTLLDRFPLALALAAYNAGEAAVERFGDVPPYPETIAYVRRVRGLLGR